MTAEQRAIILTTHSMEEADALAQRIGIMASGSMRCIGNSMHLKKKFGQGYTLELSLQQGKSKGKSEVEGEDLARRITELDSFVTAEVAEGARPMESWKGQHIRSYTLPKGQFKASKIFAALSSSSATAHQIQDWGLSQPTLSEVFLRIAREAEKDSASDSTALQISEGVPVDSTVDRG